MYVLHHLISVSFQTKKDIICLNSSASLYIERMDVLTTLQIISFFLYLFAITRKSIFVRNEMNHLGLCRH